MNIYEEVMILDPGLDEKAVEDTVEKVKDIITRRGGEILKTENWGIKKLAYELNKREKGYYILLLFKSPPSVISELERLSKVTDPIVKMMVIKLKKKRHIEAVMASLKAKEGRVDEAETSGGHQGETPVEPTKEGGEGV